MLLPYSWLKEYVNVQMPAETLREKLFSCGFEVEELTYLGKDVEGVYTGKIVTCGKHPDADRLTVCQVDCGEKGIKQIVTAATNVFAGAIVPCALDGATVKSEDGARKIKTGKLRGVVSEGMFCSGEELGINDDFYEGAEVNGILILEKDTPIGCDIRPVVGIDDWIFDIAVTANRPDCQSIYGLAREVAAVTGMHLMPLSVAYESEPTDVKIPVEVKEPKLCPVYRGSYVKDVRIGASPRWMRRRLALMGLRSVNNVVDITNYVLLEVGQPMHAFDRKFLHGDRIVVRCAEEGEKITTLDEKEFSLHPDNLLICDGERPVALAGVMGGLNSEIKEDTREVFLEAASFARDSVRKTSRALGQRSDSSARFEKGVDALFTPKVGMARALTLMQVLGCGTPTEYLTEVRAVPAETKIVRTSYAAIDKVLGIHVPKEEVNGILGRLGFVIDDRGEEFSADVPPWREDVDGYPDLAEEVIRMYGYEHIVPTFLENATVTHGGRTAEQERERKAKRTLQHQGFYECCNYSFYSPKDFDLLRLPADAPERRAVKILNPIGEDLSVMRTFLAPSMLQNIVRNVRRGNGTGKLFELANVYLADELPLKGLPHERKTLVLGQWGEGDFFDLKGAVEALGEAFGLTFSFSRGERPYLHPGATAIVRLGDRAVGYLGKLHPELSEALSLEKEAYLAELDYEEISPQFARDISYRNLPKFDPVLRDLAVAVSEETTCAEIEACILRAAKAVKRVELFDVYRGKQLGEGKKSMAFRLTFEADDRELSAQAVDGYFNKIVTGLNREFGAELR